MEKNIRIYLFFLIIVFMSSCDKEKSDTTILGSDTSFNFKNVMGKGKLTTRKGEVRAQFYKQLEGVKKFSDIQNIIVRGKLNIGVYDNNCAPFIMKNANGKLYGLDIDIAQSIAESIDVKPNFVYLGSRGEVFKKLCNGEFDIVIGQISSCFRRSEHMFFSSTYAHLKQALIVCKKDLIALDIEKNPYKYMRDHKCRIGAIDDWAYVEFAQDLFPKAEIIAYPTHQDVLEAISKHEVMAVMDDSSTLVLFAIKHPEIALSATIYILENKADNIVVAVSPTCPNLLNCINLYLENQRLCLDLNDLISKYPEVYKGK